MKHCLLICLFLASPLFAQDTPRVIDGDTFELKGKTIRLNGIDAPEHGQKCGDWNCGTQATDALAGLIEGEKVDCVVHNQDSYGRDIATCTARGQDIGGALVAQGVVWAFLKYSDAYAEAQTSAKARAIGIWSGPRDYQTPWDFRAARWDASDEQAPPGCPIKGNISQNGRIYHAPWSPWYNRTKINEARGERWFCDEAEAKAAGWRAPYWR